MDLPILHFSSPLFFLGFLGLPLLWWMFMWSQKRKALKGNMYFGSKKRFSFFSLKLLVITLIYSLFLILWADPYTTEGTQNIHRNGIDIIIALDISDSMRATDLSPNRIEKAKQVLEQFIEKQESNRVGLVVFAGKALQSIPLTFDYNIVKESVANITTDSLNQSIRWLWGTAIGDALMLGKSILEKDENSQNRQKVIILLTDGDANTGLDPQIVSSYLWENNITVYPIGIGSEQGWEIEYNNGFFKQKVKIPPLSSEALQNIASNSHWIFFRATDDSSLEAIFQTLETLEKHDISIESKSFEIPYYSPFLSLLIVLLILLGLLEFRRVEV